LSGRKAIPQGLALEEKLDTVEVGVASFSQEVIQAGGESLDLREVKLQGHYLVIVDVLQRVVDALDEGVVLGVAEELKPVVAETDVDDVDLDRQAGGLHGHLLSNGFQYGTKDGVWGDVLPPVVVDAL
jgi:hypothetical protein